MDLKAIGQESHPDWTGFLFTLTAAILFAFKGVLAKLAFAEQVGIMALLLVRFALATPLFWFGFRTLGNAKAALSGMAGRDWTFTAAAGMCFFVSVYTDFKAISLIPVGIERLLFFSYPAFVLLLSAVVSRSVPSFRHLAILVLIEFGLALVVGLFSASGFDWGMLPGIGYALGAAFSYSLFLMIAQTVTRKAGSVPFTIIANTVTFASVVLYFFTHHAASEIQMSSSGFYYICAIAVLCTVVPFFLLFEGIRRVGSIRASLISTLGPVVTVSASIAILDETMTATQWAGVVIVVLSVYGLEGARPKTQAT